MDYIPKVSVIVPVYKVEQYLPRCIDSILAQTFTDFELLLIDDGSPDNSGKICDEYADKDSRIRVFHKENGGVSSARNVGLDNAQGEWIAFVDADDKLLPLYLAEFLDYADCDLIVGGHIEFGEYNNEHKIVESIKINLNTGAVDILDFDKKYNKHNMVFYYPWGKLFKASIIQRNKIRFNTKMKLAEDYCFVIDFVSHGNFIKLVSANNYCYYRVKMANRRYSMNYDEMLRHVIEFDNCVNRAEIRFNHKFKRTKKNIHSAFFYHFFDNLKTYDRKDMCRACRDFRRDLGIKYLKDISADKSFLFYIYLTMIFYVPQLGFYFLRIKST